MQQSTEGLIISICKKDLSPAIATIDDVVAVLADRSPRRAWHTHTFVSPSGCQEKENVPVSSPHAVVESFFSTLKNELVHHQDFWTREAAQAAVFEFIEVFYNRQRLHQTLGYVSPVQFEAAHVP